MSEGSKDMRGDVLPIAIAASFLRGKGLTPGDPAEFADSGEINQSDAEPASFSVRGISDPELAFVHFGEMLAVQRLRPVYGKENIIVGHMTVKDGHRRASCLHLLSSIP